MKLVFYGRALHVSENIMYNSKAVQLSCRIPFGNEYVILLNCVSNKGNPAARHYTGMSAVAERGMVTRIMRLYEGYGDLHIPRISGS